MYERRIAVQRSSFLPQSIEAFPPHKLSKLETNDSKQLSDFQARHERYPFAGLDWYQLKYNSEESEYIMKWTLRRTTY